MRGRRWWTGCAALACGVVGCGEAPDPPTAITPAERVGAGSKGQTEGNVLEVRPSPDAVAAVPPAAVAPAPEPVPVAETPPQTVDPPPVASAPARVFSACSEARVVGCDALYVRMLAPSPALCVQLVLDNCSENSRSGLGVNLPVSWRLTSGSASSNAECDLRDYDPKSHPALTGTGTIRWDQQGRQISGLEIDIDLRIAASEQDPTLPTQVAVKTDEPLGPIDACEG
jgi:hypothetical protein